ncbi:hypothetical protein AGMMS50256_06600 [Betaproteobacteria bacterium]|nr:hypothetical protein AGMMS50256_06600 [Betaproteobacteria bacterium]
MFSLFIQKSLEFVKNIFRSKVGNILNENDVPTQVKKVETKANNIVSEAQIDKQIEMVNQTLKTRQNKIDKGLTSQNDVKQVKDLTRQEVYKTIIKDLREKQRKENTNVKTR